MKLNRRDLLRGTSAALALAKAMPANEGTCGEVIQEEIHRRVAESKCYSHQQLREIARHPIMRAAIEKTKQIIVSESKHKCPGTIEDMLVIDAAAVWFVGPLWQDIGIPVQIARKCYRPIDGASLKILCGADGRLPDPPAPAYQQMLAGRTTVSLTRDELLYRPRNVLPGRFFGTSPTEEIARLFEPGVKERPTDLLASMVHQVYGLDYGREPYRALYGRTAFGQKYSVRMQSFIGWANNFQEEIERRLAT